MSRSARIALGPLLAVIGALTLLVGLFLDWYDDLSAFTTFEVLDLVLAAVCLASLLALAEPLGARLRWARPVGTPAALKLGLVALVLVLSQLVNHPPEGVDRDPQEGLWLSLAGAALLVLGSLLAIARISLAVDVRERMDDPAREAPARPGDAADAPTVSQDPGRPG